MLPRLNLRESDDHQRERLARWLVQWELDQLLTSANAEPDSPATGTAKSDELPITDLSEERPAKTGQVRLLAPHLLPASCGPVYVCILREDSVHSFLLAPFGRFSEPCLPGELLFEHRPTGMCVLCLWNAIEASRQLLQQTWLVDEMSSREHGDATAVLKSLKTGEKLPDRLARQVGSRPWHPDDPRHDYAARERTVMEILVPTTEHSNHGRSTLYLPTAADNQSTLRAAEEHADYDTKPDRDVDDDNADAVDDSPS